MKKFTMLAIIALIASTFNLRAQNTDYKWAIGLTGSLKILMPFT
jgi:hypothetical protein